MRCGTTDDCIHLPLFQEPFQTEECAVHPTRGKTGLHAAAAIDQVLTILYGATCRMSRGVCLTSLGRRKRRALPTYCGGDWHVLEWVCYGCVADSNERDLGEDAPPCSQNCLSSKATQVCTKGESQTMWGRQCVILQCVILQCVILQCVILQCSLVFLAAGLVAPHAELTTPTGWEVVPTVLFIIILYCL